MFLFAHSASVDPMLVVEDLEGEIVARDDGSGGGAAAFLTPELACMDLCRCELAVLSACGTGIGYRKSGQGVASLQQALHAAGVQASVTSLWKVFDESTSVLMRRFYEAWWSRGLGKAESLRDAEGWMSRQIDPISREPRCTTRDWAGWVLVGDDS